MEVSPMKASKKSTRCKKIPPAWHANFEAMIPSIETHAKIAFRHLDGAKRNLLIEATGARYRTLLNEFRVNAFG